MRKFPFFGPKHEDEHQIKWLEYVNRVLLPNEKVYYVGRVSAVVYLPAFITLGLAIAAAKYLPGLDQRAYLFNSLGAWLYDYLPLVVGNMARIVIWLLILIAVVMLIRGFIISISTELAVTSRRVIAKYGFYNTVTTDIDRHKIAGVIVSQTLTGKMFNFGNIVLRGYSGDISHLPPISYPFDFQKYVNSRIRM